MHPLALQHVVMRMHDPVGVRVLVSRSTTPFCDAARVLLGKEGVTLDTLLIMRHGYDALRRTVGRAAGSTGGKSVFRGWQCQ